MKLNGDKMEQAIKKLISEYSFKVEQQEILLEEIKIRNTEARHADDKDLQRELRIDRNAADARKQAYIQAIHDIDSLLDFV
jgi:hypothetical protein